MIKALIIIIVMTVMAIIGFIISCAGVAYSEYGSLIEAECQLLCIAFQIAAATMIVVTVLMSAAVIVWEVFLK